MSKFVALTVILTFVFISKSLCDNTILGLRLPILPPLPPLPPLPLLPPLPVINVTQDGPTFGFSGPNNSYVNINLTNHSASGNISLAGIIVGSASISNLTSFEGNITVGNFTTAGGGDLNSLSLNGGIIVINETATNGKIDLKNGILFKGTVSVANVTTGEEITYGPSSIYAIGFGNDSFPLLHSQSVNISQDGVAFNATGPLIDLINCLLILALLIF